MQMNCALPGVVALRHSRMAFHMSVPSFVVFFMISCISDMVALSSLAVSMGCNEARDSVSLIYICGPGLYSTSREYF